MRVLVAPDRYGELLTAGAAAEAIAAGWCRAAPGDEVRTLPLSDGGPGWLDVQRAGLGAGAVTDVLTVPDPWGRLVPIEVLLTRAPNARDAGSRYGGPGPADRTAYLEAAQVLGAHTRQPGDNPATASSSGLGVALAAAVDSGVGRIVVGLSGSLVLDAGFGLLAALGAGPSPQLAGGALALGGLGADDLRLSAVDRRLAGVHLVGAADLHQPLLGLQGVAATWGGAAGADPESAQHIEASLGHVVALARRARPEPTELLTGAPRRLDRVPGVGAGAGIGFAFALLGGQLKDGSECAAAEVGLEAALDGADLVVTGTAVLGWESLRSGVVRSVTAAAQRHGIPVLVVAGRLAAGRRETLAAGINGAYAVCPTLATWPGFAARPVHQLTDRVATVARTWSPHTSSPATSSPDDSRAPID